MNIRDAAAIYAMAITEICNRYILNTSVAFEEQAVVDEEMAQRISDVRGAGLPW